LPSLHCPQVLVAAAGDMSNWHCQRRALAIDDQVCAHRLSFRLMAVVMWWVTVGQITCLRTTADA
jgi:hypothetical protein